MAKKTPPRRSVNKRSKSQPKHKKRKRAVKETPQFPSFKEWIQLDPKIWGGLALILLLTAIVFSPGFSHEFTNWDDNVYVSENLTIRGLDGEHLKEMFMRPTAEIAGNYHPITVLSLAVNYAMGKTDFPVYYGTNLLLHLLNTVLVFFFVYLFLGKKWLAGLFTAFFFAIHPMHVESMAWIAERKDVLYTFFFMLTLIGYLRYKQTQHMPTYFLLLVCFTLSLLSKPAAVVLPVVLVLIDWYQGNWNKSRVLMEKIPFFIGALILGLVTMSVQETAGALTTHTNDFVDKIMVSSYGFLTYIVMLFVPIKQAAYHAYPENGFTLIYKIAPLIAVGVGVLSVWSMKWRKIGLFGMLFYLINIALVLQLIGVGDTIISERYTYVPYIGLLLLLGWGVDYFLEKNGANKELSIAMYSLLGLLAIASTFATYQRVQVWENSDTLFTDTIEKYPYAARPYISRGHYRGRIAEQYRNAQKQELATQWQDSALADYQLALAIQPDYMAYNNVGDIFVKRGNTRKALGNFQQAVEIKNDFAIGYANIATCQLRLGNSAEAMKSINQALQLNGRQGTFYFIRSILYKNQGNRAKALEDARNAQRFGYAVPASHMQELQ